MSADSSIGLFSISYRFVPFHAIFSRALTYGFVLFRRTVNFPSVPVHSVMCRFIPSLAGSPCSALPRSVVLMNRFRALWLNREAFQDEKVELNAHKLRHQVWLRRHHNLYGLVNHKQDRERGDSHSQTNRPVCLLTLNYGLYPPGLVFCCSILPSSGCHGGSVRMEGTNSHRRGQTAKDGTAVRSTSPSGACSLWGKRSPRSARVGENDP